MNMIRYKEIQILKNKTEFIAIQPTDGATGYMYDHLNIWFGSDADTRFSIPGPGTIITPENIHGVWKILGTLDNIQESVWQKIMPLVDDKDELAGYERFMSDKEFEMSDHVDACSTATESAMSLFKTNEVDSNSVLLIKQ